MRLTDAAWRARATGPHRCFMRPRACGSEAPATAVGVTAAQAGGGCLLHLARRDDVVDLEDHAHDLCSQVDLLLLADERLEHLLLLHVVGALKHAVDAQVGLALLGLHCLYGGDFSDWVKPRVLGERARRHLERLREGPHRVLLDRAHLVGFLEDLERARQLRGAAAIHNLVGAHQIAHDADGVVERALRLVDDHAVAATHEDSHGTRVRAVLDDNHAVLGRAKRLLVHLSCCAELLRAQLAEARDDARVTCDRDQLELHAAHPPHRRQASLHQQVVRFIVEAPLADDKVST
mmetsp:Transcript_66724/g.132224  ORF Transcript_66724/g.132224 Transcript_66724/m.132224 type:complete len:292 (-) Transcript_66724:940-1815(-)